MDVLAVIKDKSLAPDRDDIAPSKTAD